MVGPALRRGFGCPAAGGGPALESGSGSSVVGARSSETASDTANGPSLQQSNAEDLVPDECQGAPYCGQLSYTSHCNEHKLPVIINSTNN